MDWGGVRLRETHGIGGDLREGNEGLKGLDGDVEEEIDTQEATGAEQKTDQEETGREEETGRGEEIAMGKDGLDEIAKGGGGLRGELKWWDKTKWDPAEKGRGWRSVTELDGTGVEGEWQTWLAEEF